MKKYDVTLTAHYKKTVAVYAKTPAHAREKMETILFDTDLIDFTDEDFVSGEAAITDPCDYDCEENEAVSEDIPDGNCSDCAYCCPMCGGCLCGDED